MKKFILFSILISSLLDCELEYPPLPNFELKVLPVIGDTTIFCEFWIESDELKTFNHRKYEFSWDYNGDDLVDNSELGAIKSIHKFSKPGKYNANITLRDEFGQSSSASVEIEILGSNKNIETLIDPRDGEEYQTVLVAGKWWMAENLRYGEEIEIKNRQTDNGKVEKYVYGNFSQSRVDPIGGVYHWWEAMNYGSSSKGICPDGWHIPNDEDWNDLFSSFAEMNRVQYVQYITSELSGLNFDNGIKLSFPIDYSLPGSIFNNTHSFWSSSSNISSNSFCAHIANPMSSSISHKCGNNYDYHLSVRCIKNDL